MSFSHTGVYFSTLMLSVGLREWYLASKSSCCTDSQSSHLSDLALPGSL